MNDEKQEAPDRVWIRVYEEPNGSTAYEPTYKCDKIAIEYIRKDIADGYKQTAEEERKTRLITEQLRNQLIKDGLLDGKIICYEQLQEVLNPLVERFEKYDKQCRNTLIGFIARDLLEGVEETLKLAGVIDEEGRGGRK